MDLRKLAVLRYFDRASSGFPAWTMSAPCRTLAEEERDALATARLFGRLF
jgi:hypothetical protein